MRIPSSPTLENSVFRPIPVCDASAPWPPRGLVRLCFCERRCRIGLRRRGDEKKTALFLALSEVLLKSPLLNTLRNRSEFKRSEDYRRQGLLSVGYPTLAGTAISIR